MGIIPASPDNNAIRELRDELKDLNKNLKETAKSNERISIYIAIIAILQLLIGTFQFILAVLDARNIGWAVLIEVIFLVVIIVFLKKIKPIFNRWDKENTDLK